MAQIAKIEAQAEIKSSPDKFHGFFKDNITSFPQMFPQIFKSVEVVGGGALRAGAVFSCKYDLGKRLIMFNQQFKSFIFGFFRYIHIYICVCVYIHMCVYIYTYTYILYE